MRRYPTVLAIAGSDSSGGAGIQADLKTIASLGCYGATVITALTAQNTEGVKSIFPVSPLFVQQQMETVLSDIVVDVVKTGMLYSAEIIEMVAATLKNFSVSSVIVDPVMISTSGDALLCKEALETLKKKLIPQASLLTPNLHEAALLLGRSTAITAEEMESCARDLLSLGCQGVLLKGGHLNTKELKDVYINREGEMLVLTAKKIKTRNTHGTGCTLASAIASYKARGDAWKTAIEKAHKYVHDAINTGKRITMGKGNGPVNHSFKPKKMLKIKR